MPRNETRLAVVGQRPAGTPHRGLFTPEEVREAYRCLQEAHARGDLERQRCEHMLNAFKFVDAHGRAWSIGSKTGGWYYNFNFQWYPGEPCSMLTRLDSASPTCLHCGSDTPSRSAVYCIICGRPLSALPSRNTLVVDARTSPASKKRDLRHRLTVACLALALAAVAILLYMYLSGSVLYAGFGADSLLPPALLAPLISRRAGRRKPGQPRGGGRPG